MMSETQEQPRTKRNLSLTSLSSSLKKLLRRSSKKSLDVEKRDLEAGPVPSPTTTTPARAEAAAPMAAEPAGRHSTPTSPTTHIRASLRHAPSDAALIGTTASATVAASSTRLNLPSYPSLECLLEDQLANPSPRTSRSSIPTMLKRNSSSSVPTSRKASLANSIAKQRIPEEDTHPSSSGPADPPSQTAPKKAAFTVEHVNVLKVQPLTLSEKMTRWYARSHAALDAPFMPPEDPIQLPKKLLEEQANALALADADVLDQDAPSSPVCRSPSFADLPPPTYDAHTSRRTQRTTNGHTRV